MPEKNYILALDAGTTSSAGALVDLKPMVRDFYNRMGWDEQGVPLPDTLKAMGLARLGPGQLQSC